MNAKPLRLSSLSFATNASDRRHRHNEEFMRTATDSLARVREIAAALLRNADADGRLPTPVDDLISAAGLVESGEYVLSESRIRQAPRELRQLLRAAGRKVRGILDRRERIVHVN